MTIASDRRRDNVAAGDMVVLFNPERCPILIDAVATINDLRGRPAIGWRS